jgi:hypothetical protein
MARKGIQSENLEKVVEVMELRGEIRIMNGTIIKRSTSFLLSPCIECHLKDVCSPSGVISPSVCPYLDKW